MTDNMNKIWQSNLRATSTIDNNMHANKNQSYYCSKRSHTSTWLLSLTWTPLTNKVFLWNGHFHGFNNT